MSGLLTDQYEHEAHMERGSNALLAAIEAAISGNTPATSDKLVWRSVGYPVPEDKERFDFIPPTAPGPDRNPCRRCGTRRDIGCKHFPSTRITPEIVNRAWDETIDRERARYGFLDVVKHPGDRA